jgi:hypothetical protein
VIENPSNTGSIWYTLDGSDPRAPGGELSAGAVSGGRGPVTLEFQSSVHVTARIRSGEAWSAPRELMLWQQEEDYSVLKITELHYHPDPMVIEGDTTSSKDLEFIEFKNTGSETIWLGGLVLDSAVYYEFPEDALLAPGHFYVLASDASAFYRRYGMLPSGTYDRNFSNGGEEILLRDGSFYPPIYFHYSDNSPWPTGADGYGFSLVSQEIDPTMEPADPSYWRNSTYRHGSPFANDPFSTHTPGESLANATLRVYPNPTSGWLNVEWQAANWPARVELSIYGIRGNLVHREYISGDHRMDLHQLNLSPGAYLMTVGAGDHLLRSKVILQ